MSSATTLRFPSYKEDTYFISHLKSFEKKALQEHKDKLSASFETERPTMWGVLLLSGDERVDVVLLKFLRARDFKVPDSFNMLKKCLAWRREFKADTVEDEDLGFEEPQRAVAYMHGYDRDGHPVCYNSYGVFKDKETIEKILGDDAKMNKFLRWRV